MESTVIVNVDYFHSVSKFKGLTKLVSCCVSENGSALIKVEPRNQLVRKGDSARFDCVYQNANITEWYFKGKTDPISKNSTR